MQDREKKAKKKAAASGPASEPEDQPDEVGPDVTEPEKAEENVEARVPSKKKDRKETTIRYSKRAKAAGICQLAVSQAINGNVNGLLRGVGDKNTNEAVKHIVELAKRASSGGEVLHTDFLTPLILKESMLVLEKFTDIKTVAQGGYPEAERCRLSVGHPQELTSDPDIVVALRQVIGCPLSWIAREALGDILVQGEGAQILIVPELADFITSTLDKVGNVPVTCEKIPLLALEYKPPRTQTFKTVEPSLRVDAIASAGFKISRTKLVDLIRSGDVRVNWTTVTKGTTTMKTGDIVSVSGKGRLKIGEINPTKKGKFAVELIRYL
ncbi:hypothetical protein RHSIM_Rhsim04G0021500 [Rhododendron simsii]|uniref:RNA-binding S4 domain-containing protein n=1 Tax=Rhododendron simsii TaxID=118357 RepID=A0A834LQB5_RHOSS|nr:hypothetical protein RHSIM_Rhsim04G0021500 [Rhododendron simsii]